MKLVVVVGLLLGLATLAHAQPGMVAPTVPTVASDEAKSENTALALSIVGTVAPIALIAAGSRANNDSMVGIGMLSAVLTPSLGHWYAGHYFTWGLGMRVGGIALAFAGAVSAFGSCFDTSPCDDTGAGIAVLAGGALYLSGIIYDIATAGGAAREWNTHHLSLAPAMITSGGHTNVGLGMTGAF